MCKSARRQILDNSHSLDTPTCSTTVSAPTPNTQHSTLYHTQVALLACSNSVLYGIMCHVPPQF